MEIENLGGLSAIEVVGFRGSWEPRRGASYGNAIIQSGHNLLDLVTLDVFPCDRLDELVRNGVLTRLVNHINVRTDEITKFMVLVVPKPYSLSDSSLGSGAIAHGIQPGFYASIYKDVESLKKNVNVTVDDLIRQCEDHVKMAILLNPDHPVINALREALSSQETVRHAVSSR